MNRNLAPFGLRIPVELKTKIEESAAKNLRSLNAEMIVRLEVSFAADQKRLNEFSVGDLIDELIRRGEPGKITVQIDVDE